jgi:hypothetical protein
MPITDEDVLHELLHRATDDLRAPSAVTAGIVASHYRRLRNTRILSIATTSVTAAAVVAAVIVARVGPAAAGHGQNPAALPATELPATELPATGLPATGLPATKLPPVKLTAMRVLDHLSVVAAHAEQPAGRYIALTEIDLDAGAAYPENFPSELLNPKLAPFQKERLQQMVTEYADERTVIFDGVTGDVWAYQNGDDVPSEAPASPHRSPTRAEFASWPTDPAKLRALLVRQAGDGVGLDILGQTYTADDMVFEEATAWLWNPLLSPALRSAMYKVLAATPGVTVKTGTTDTAGQPAIEISRSDSFAGEESTFESPGTGAVLEQDFADVGPALYAGVTGYATPPANPYRG